MDDERELKDRRYSLYFLLNSDEEQLPLDSCRCGDLASSSFPSSPVYSWSSSSPASRSQSVSPTPTTAASTSTTAFAPPRSCFQQDWGSSQPYYYHTYQSGGTSTVDEVVTQPCRDKSLLQFKEKIESALKSQHHHRRTQESSSPSPNNNNVNDNAERPRPSASSSRRSRQRSPSTSSAIPPAYSLSSPTALPHLPGQSSFLYCRKKITRKQSKKRLTPERRTVFYNCRVFEDGRQLHYTRDNKVLPRVPSSSSSSSSSRTTTDFARHQALRRTGEICKWLPYQWFPKERDYEAERAENALARTLSTANHPLKPNSKNENEEAANASPLHASQNGSSGSVSTKRVTSTFIDPLSAGDPLSAPQPTPSSNITTMYESGSMTRSTSSPLVARKASTKRGQYYDQEEDPTFVPWSMKKKDILTVYTTDEQVGIQMSFMEETGTRLSVAVDKQKQRLEELDETDEALEKQYLKISQKEYIAHIEKLNEELRRAWENEERVKTLKIAIQCAKVLGDISVIKFYPSKWTICTEILDTFGKLVYERIWERASQHNPSTGQTTYLPDNFSPKDVPEVARETCRNWFFKIASIRELLPRIYVEMAIIKCYAFLSQNSYREVINRLCMMIRGVGDPLIAMYLRAYLARKGREIAPQLTEHLTTSFNDYLYTHQIVTQRPAFQKMLDSHKLALSDYIHLYSPALDWLLQCIAHKAPVDVFQTTLAKYRKSGNSLVLNHIISSFPPDYIAANARPIAALIKESDGLSYAKHKLYHTFGVCLALAPAPPESERLALLNDVWKVVAKFEDAKEYIAVAEVWIEYPLKHCTASETNRLIQDIVAHAKKDKAYDSIQPQLASIVHKVLSNYPDFTATFTTMSNFLPLFDLFTSATQVEVSKALLEAFAKNKSVTSDPLLINTVFTAAKALHDSVNTLSFSDEVRQIASLISAFITKVDFGREVIKHLDFYVECRRAFANLDGVKSTLVLGACNLAMRTLKLTQGKHTKKTAAFVRACVAYTFISIPSMDDPFAQLYLYIYAGQVALANQSLPQADSLFKAAITLVQEIPPYTETIEAGGSRSNETWLLNFISYFAAVLVAVPGHPEQGAFYLVKGLIKARNYPWEAGSISKSLAYVSILAYFSTQAQMALPYHFPKVDANDVLYGGDDAFKKEQQAIIDRLLELILEQMAALKAEATPASERKQKQLACALFEHTVRFAGLNTKSASLAANLFNMAKKCGATPGELRTYLVPLRSAPASTPAADLHAKLASSIS